MKPVLFVDVDGTIADSMPHWVDLYNHAHATNHKPEDIKSWGGMNDVFEDMGAFDEYFKDYRGVLPVYGSLRAIEKLRTKFRVVFVTVGFGKQWLFNWFAPDKNDFMICADRSLLRGFALVDDAPHNLDVFVGQRFLMAQPWNINQNLNETNWDAITDYLMEVDVEALRFTE